LEVNKARAKEKQSTANSKSTRGPGKAKPNQPEPPQ